MSIAMDLKDSYNQREKMIRTCCILRNRKKVEDYQILRDSKSARTI